MNGVTNMKKIKYMMLIAISMALLTGCEKKDMNKRQPELSQMRTICNLATLETYYHNVAKITDKPVDPGLSGLFQRKDRTMWIEYTGIARIGIDMSKVNMKMDGNKVTISLPDAEILSIEVDHDIDKSSYYYSEDNALFFKNEFTAKDQTTAIADGQKKMRETIENNSQLLMQAQERAKNLIEKYIVELGNISDQKYDIEWIDLEQKES